jgi:hypothetical protein
MELSQTRVRVPETPLGQTPFGCYTHSGGVLVSEPVVWNIRLYADITFGTYFFTRALGSRNLLVSKGGKR